MTSPIPSHFLSNFLKPAAISTALVFLAHTPYTANAKEQPAQTEAATTMSATENIRRFHSVTGLKPEKADYYIKLHAETWPGIKKMITACHIRNYSIALKEIDGKLYLFSYFEYTGDDFDADMKRMAEDPETQRWWKETDPCQSPLPDAAAQNKIWSDAKEVFHLE